MLSFEPPWLLSWPSLISVALTVQRFTSPAPSLHRCFSGFCARACALTPDSWFQTLQRCVSQSLSLVPTQLVSWPCPAVYCLFWPPVHINFCPNLRWSQSVWLWNPSSALVPQFHNISPSKSKPLLNDTTPGEAHWRFPVGKSIPPYRG